MPSCLQEGEKVLHPYGSGGRGHKGMEVDPLVRAVDQTPVAHKRHDPFLIMAQSKRSDVSLANTKSLLQDAFVAKAQILCATDLSAWCNTRFSFS